MKTTRSGESFEQRVNHENVLIGSVAKINTFSIKQIERSRKLSIRQKTR